MKMKAALKEGFRIHHIDNTHTDYAEGDTVETSQIPPRQLEERLMAGHLVPVSGEKPGNIHATMTTEAPEDPIQTPEAGKGTKGKK